MSYFSIEHNQKCMDHIVLKDRDDNVAFGDYLNITYDEMKSREDLEEFVVAIFGAVNEDDDSQTLITLVGDDDIFIWGIIMGMVDDDLRYVLIDWKKDGKNYKYESANKDLTN